MHLRLHTGSFYVALKRRWRTQMKENVAPWNRLGSVMQPCLSQGARMNSFLQRFGRFVVGVLHGYDRLRFRGSKRQLCHVNGMMSWLGVMRILLKDYKTWVRDTTATLCQAIQAPAEQADLYVFLNNSKDSKEQTALQLAKKH